MTRLLLVAHAPLASALKAVALHAYPECGQALGVLDVDPGESPERLETRLRELIGDEETLVLTDVFGATPCNAAMRLADGCRVKVIAGLNVPMLWRCLCYADQTLASLASLAVGGGSQGIVQLATARPQNQAAPAVSVDDLHIRHHSQ